MKVNNTQKTVKLRRIDDIDRQILNILSKNARTKLTKIAREIRLSVDSTKKRLQRLEQDVITKYTIQVNLERLNVGLGIHIYIKLKDIAKESYDEFIKELMRNPKVIDLMSMLGDYDLYVVILAKDTFEMDQMKMELKQKFGRIIGDWKEVLVSKIYKLEEYRF